MTLKAMQAATLASVFLFASCAVANEGDDVAGDRGEAIRDYVDQVHERLGFSGVVLAGRDGKVVAAVARGSSNDGNEATRLTSKSLFEIASCTKPFTAIVILQLAESGKLSLSDPITKHLPDIPSHSRGITIRHLLAHTSGIPGTNTSGAGGEIEKVLPTFLAGGPKHAPGEHFEYWNQGYALLSEIIARTSGRSYSQSIREGIFNRCGMAASCFTGDRPPAGANVAVGLSSRGGSRSALDHPYGSYGFQYRGMGGLVTNVQDLWKWDRSLRKRELLSDQSFKNMTAAGRGGYGLGWYIKQDPDGEPCHRHGGSVRGFLAEIRRYPSVDGSLFVLSNQDDALSLRLMNSGIEQILFGQSPATELPKPPSPEFVNRVAGEYEDAKRRRLTIAKSRGLPTLKINWGGPITAGYLGLDESDQPQLYLLAPAQGKLQFKVDGALEFPGSPTKAQAVSLLSLTPTLTFRRLNP